VAITTDFDGQPRFPNPGYPENLSYPATAPDVGADEFAGQPSFTCEQPNPGNTLSTFNNICWGKPIVLSLQTPPVGTGNTYQWQSSPDGAVYSNISGANASTYGLTPVTHAWYRCYIVCQNGNLSAYSNPIHIVFANEITSTNSPVERCGIGTVNLEAVASGGTVTWYTTETGGESIGTGSPFASPPITGSTTFWVGADDIAPQETVGRSAPAVTTGTTLSNYGLVFNALSDIVLNTVDVYPVSTAGNMNVAVYNSSQVLVAGPLAIPFPTGNGATPFTATLNFNVPQGTGYRLVITSMSGGSLVRESSSISYPYSSSNVSITHGATSLTGTTSTSYYWFYNIKATGGCQSVRVPVVADVVSPPDIMVSNDATVCNDIISELTVISNPSLFDLYVWSPVTHLFTDPGCTIPYTGTNSMTVYVRTNIADEYHYTCTEPIQRPSAPIPTRS
jgi:hypothetical protein